MANYQPLNLSHIIDIVLVGLYSNTTLNVGINLRQTLADNSVYYGTEVREIINDKLKLMPYWECHELASLHGTELSLTQNAAGYDFFREHTSYTNYLHQKKSRSDLLDKAITDSANATVSAADSAKRSVYISGLSLIISLIALVFSVLPKNEKTEQGKSNNVSKKSKYIREQSRELPTQKTHLVKKPTIPLSETLVRSKK